MEVRTESFEGRVVYEGEWEGWYRQGQGTFFRSDGSKAYVGEWHRSLPHGTGSEFEGEQVVYHGQWEEGDRSGTGSFYASGELRFTGEWRHDMRNGTGFEFRDGKLTYAGQWHMDRAHGEGVRYFLKGSVQYRGEFYEGEYHGKGSLWRADGSLHYVGRFRSGRFQGIGQLYEGGECVHAGFFEDGRPCGQGVQRLPACSAGSASSSAERYFFEGRFSGLDSATGQLVNACGHLFYEGEWNGGKHGHGRDFESTTGASPAGTRGFERGGLFVKYSGEWRYGMRCGRGSEYASGMLQYEGQWLEGRKHGWGRSYVDGVFVRECQWHRGEPTEENNVSDPSCVFCTHLLPSSTPAYAYSGCGHRVVCQSCQSNNLGPWASQCPVCKADSTLLKIF